MFTAFIATKFFISFINDIHLSLLLLSAICHVNAAPEMTVHRNMSLTLHDRHVTYSDIQSSLGIGY